jgi:hypothetical protein
MKVKNIRIIIIFWKEKVKKKRKSKENLRLLCGFIIMKMKDNRYVDRAG